MEALANNPALLNALQSRLNTLVGKSSGYVESLPEEIQEKLKELSEIQLENLKLEMEFRAQVLELEKKFNKLHVPLYEKRFEIISGKNADGGIPAFWYTAMSTHPLISEMIFDGDEEALKYLSDIRVEYKDDNPGFKLEFLFDENPFFTNKSLEKTYYLGNNPEDPFGDLIYQKAVGTSIDWKADHDLTCKVEMKKQRHKGTKETRMVKKTIPRETFFSFFSPIQLPQEDDEVEEDDLPEDFEEKIEMDYEIGEILKEKIIPRAVDWFTGKALQDEDMDEWDDEEEEEDEDDEGEDDEEDENQGNQGNSENAKGENPPECKQQ